VFEFTRVLKNLTMKKLQQTLTQVSPTTRHTKNNLGLHLTILFYKSLAVLKYAASVMCKEFLMNPIFYTHETGQLVYVIPYSYNSATINRTKNVQA